MDRLILTIWNSTNHGSRPDFKISLSDPNSKEWQKIEIFRKIEGWRRFLKRLTLGRVLDAVGMCLAWSTRPFQRPKWNRARASGRSRRTRINFLIASRFVRRRRGLSSRVSTDPRGSFAVIGRAYTPGDFRATGRADLAGDVEAYDSLYGLSYFQKTYRDSAPRSTEKRNRGTASDLVALD